MDLDQDALDATAKALDPESERMLALAANLVDESAAIKAVADALARFGKLDVLVNVAAVRVYGPVTEATGESWDHILGVNLRAVANCCKYAIPRLAATGGGSIVTVSSSNAMVGRGGMAQYDASKAALLALTRSMACDHAAERIRVNTVSPGPTLTQFHVRNRSARTGESLADAGGRGAEYAPRTAGRANRDRLCDPVPRWPGIVVRHRRQFLDRWRIVGSSGLTQTSVSRPMTFHPKEGPSLRWNTTLSDLA